MHRSTCGVVVRAAVLAVALGSTLSAQELPRVGEAERSVAAPRSLAEFAARIELRKPDDGGPVVVSDGNLSELAGRGTISMAGEPAEPAPELPFDTGPSEAEIAEFQKRVEDQELAVAEVERQLREYEARVQQARSPQWYYGPENFAPGQVSVAQVVREDIELDLADEREKLDALRREGRRDGLIPSR